MKDSVISAPVGAMYLQDWMKEIPANCVLNKGVTGCGATTLAIKQPGHTIIAVPFVGLIKNKVAQHGDEILGICESGDKTEEIRQYLQGHPTVKILTTYDSLPKVNRILVSLGNDPYSDYHLVVDEWHILFQAYLFRNNAVRGLLEETRKFNRVTYVSATPIERKYWLTEVKTMPEVKIAWPDAEQTHIETWKVDKPLEYMASLCRNRSSNGGDSNYHIFLNSVRGISKIISLANLHPDSVRVVCSRSEGSLKRNQLILPPGFRIGTTSDPVKPFNFYTSTCFEGQDIYDENGRTFIVSDGFTNHTKVDIATSLIQICGRIRDSRFKNQVTQIYSESRYHNVTLEEFEATLQANVVEAEKIAAALDTLPQRVKGNWLEKAATRNEPYITIEDGHITVDLNVANLEIVNYKIVNGIYGPLCNMVKALKSNGFVIDSAVEMDVEPEAAPSSTPKRETFKKLFEEYCEIMDNRSAYSIVPDLRQERIEYDKPLVKEAYTILGVDEVRRLNYHVSNIKRAITAKSRDDENVKITRLVNQAFPKQKAIPSAKVKKGLQEIYDTLGIPSKAKATDLAKWYDIKRSTVRIDGISTACITILHQYINFGI